MKTLVLCTLAILSFQAFARSLNMGEVLNGLKNFKQEAKNHGWILTLPATEDKSVLFFRVLPGSKNTIKSVGFTVEAAQVQKSENFLILNISSQIFTTRQTHIIQNQRLF